MGSTGFEQAISDIVADFAGGTTLPYPVIFVRIMGALLLSAVIGLEREARDRPAGLRTHMLVSLAACIFAILAIEVPNAAIFGGREINSDPLRVVEAVTSGVAFLAAGFIVFSKGEVHGLTTGAGIWLAAAIGVSTGFGMWGLALAAAVFGSIVLLLLLRLERWMDWK